MSPRRFWRLAFVADPELACRGARGPGRWNGPRTRPVYCAEAISLAALERLVYVGWDVAAGAYPTQHLFRIDLPDDAVVERVAAADLPARWTELRAPLEPGARPTALQRLGDDWWRRRSALALLVPSAQVPEESNLLLHPEHPDWRRVEVAYEREFRYDARVGRARRR